MKALADLTGALTFCLLSQELKQDISSFRYEVMGMMKTGKPALQGERSASSSSGECSLTYPNTCLKVSTCAPSSQAKSKLNRFKMAASILKQVCSTASPRPPDASNGLPNGLLALGPDESSSEKSGQRRNFPKDITDFGLFQKRHRGTNEATSGTGELSREMYSLSEEAGDSVGSDAEEEDRERTARSEDEDLLEMETSDTVNRASKEKRKSSNTNKSLQDDRDSEEEEIVPHTDSVAGGCDGT